MSGIQCHTDQRGHLNNFFRLTDKQRHGRPNFRLFLRAGILPDHRVGLFVALLKHNLDYEALVTKTVLSRIDVLTLDGRNNHQLDVAVNVLFLVVGLNLAGDVVDQTNHANQQDGQHDDKHAGTAGGFVILLDLLRLGSSSSRRDGPGRIDQRPGRVGCLPDRHGCGVRPHGHSGRRVIGGRSLRRRSGCRRHARVGYRWGGELSSRLISRRGVRSRRLSLSGWSCLRSVELVLGVWAGDGGCYRCAVSPGDSHLPVAEASQLGPKLFSRRVPVRRILLQQPGDEAVHGGRHIRVTTDGPRCLFLHMLVGDGDRCVAEEGRLTNHHLKQDDAQRIQVTAGVDGLALGLFRREVGGGSHDRPGLGQLVIGAAEGTSDTKVSHLHLTGLGDHDVAGLDVAVDRAVAMGEAQSNSDLVGYLGRPLTRNRGLSGDDISQRLAFHILHDNEVRAVVLAPVVDRDHVGVIQIGGGLSLPPEPSHKSGLSGVLREQHFDRHRAIQKLILGQEHIGHAPAGNSTMQFVASIEDRASGRRAGHNIHMLLSSAG